MSFLISDDKSLTPLSDGLNGIYVIDDNSKLDLDGFGNAKLITTETITTGTYLVDGEKVIVTIEDNQTTYLLDKTSEPLRATVYVVSPFSGHKFVNSEKNFYLDFKESAGNTVKGDINFNGYQFGATFDGSFDKEIINGETVFVLRITLHGGTYTNAVDDKKVAFKIEKGAITCIETEATVSNSNVYYVSVDQVYACDGFVLGD
jgi:hypothetical protein